MKFQITYLQGIATLNAVLIILSARSWIQLGTGKGRIRLFQKK
jgi:hypothetical protein